MGQIAAAPPVERHPGKIVPMRLAVIHTAGTITCTGSPLTPMAAPPFAAACRDIVHPSLIQASPDLELDYVTDLRFPESASGTLDSTNLQPSDWCLLAGRILADYDLYDGCVVLHGTDSMAYTASALPFLLSAFDKYGNVTITLDKPVIVTGSQVPLFAQETPNSPLVLCITRCSSESLRCGRGRAFGHVRGRCCLPRPARHQVERQCGPRVRFAELPPWARVGINFELNTAVVLPGPVSKDVALSNPVTRARVIFRQETRIPRKRAPLPARCRRPPRRASWLLTRRRWRPGR